MNGNSYGLFDGLWLSLGSGVIPETSAVEFGLVCVALARSASCHSNRSSQVNVEELVVPVGIAAASVVVVFISFREGGSFCDRLLTSSRRRLLHPQTARPCVRDS